MTSRLLLALGLAIPLFAAAAPAGGDSAASQPAAASAPAPEPAATQASPEPAAAQPAPPVAAAVQAPQPQFTSPAAPSTGSLLQTLFALVFVLGLLAALAWFVKRFNPRGVGSAANVRMVGALSLGARERIVVVEVGDQWIVVGASPGRINALATMPKQEGAEPQAAAAGAMPAGFADWLKQTIDKRNAK